MLPSLPQIQLLVTRVMSRSGSTGTVTFQRTAETVGNAGGTTAANANTSPTNIPCIVAAQSTTEKQAGNKTIEGANYKIYVPAVYSGSPIDVDSKCIAVVTGWNGSSRTYNLSAPKRHMDILIELDASLEE